MRRQNSQALFRFDQGWSIRNTVIYNILQHFYNLLPKKARYGTVAKNTRRSLMYHSSVFALTKSSNQSIFPMLISKICWYLSVETELGGLFWPFKIERCRRLSNNAKKLMCSTPKDCANGFNELRAFIRMIITIYNHDNIWQYQELVYEIWAWLAITWKSGWIKSVP